mmetsp:Transcript_30898/g.91898  ORF Transcript_30898/g.91898 Transcript_30898/m.91898 type:complete len:313 (+) Transcript_30898:555-1493(+)
MDRVRAMLLGSGAQPELWGEAVVAAAHVLNLSPSARRHGTTPHGGLFGTPTNVAHLRVWGCPCYVMVPCHKRGKLSARTTPGRFVGYDSTAAFRVLLQDGRIQVSRDVTFPETSRFEPALYFPGVPQTSRLVDFLMEFGSSGADVAHVAAPADGAPGNAPVAAPKPGAGGSGDYADNGTDNCDFGGGAARAAPVPVSDHDTAGGGDGGVYSTDGHHGGGGDDDIPDLVDSDDDTAEEPAAPEPELRRSTRVRRAPGEWWDAHAMLARRAKTEPSGPVEPQTRSQAMNLVNSNDWLIVKPRRWRTSCLMRCGS